MNRRGSGEHLSPGSSRLDACYSRSRRFGFSLCNQFRTFQRTGHHLQQALASSEKIVITAVEFCPQLHRGLCFLPWLNRRHQNVPCASSEMIKAPGNVTEKLKKILKVCSWPSATFCASGSQTCCDSKDDSFTRGRQQTLMKAKLESSEDVIMSILNIYSASSFSILRLEKDSSYEVSALTAPLFFLQVYSLSLRFYTELL